MNLEQKNLWLTYIAGGMLAAGAFAIVADQVKTNNAQQTHYSVASQSASSQPLAVDSSPVNQMPESIPSSKKLEDAPALRDITPADRDIIIGGKHYQVPMSSDCSDGGACYCTENGRSCFVVIDSKDQHIFKSFVCSHGIWVTSEEYEYFGDMLYRNVCRPPGEPLLKSCRFGEICETQGIKEGERCMAEHEQLSICHCGMVFNFSTPDLRKDADQIQCLVERTCKPPPNPPIHL